MIKFSLQNKAYTIIELVIALTVSILVLGGIVTAFQSFVSYNGWIVNYTKLQKEAARDVKLLEEIFADNLKILDSEDEVFILEKVYARNNDNLGIHLASTVKTAGIGQQTSLVDSTGYLALHQTYLHSESVIVGSDLYLVDTGFHIIRRVDLSTGNEDVTPYAGVLGSPGALNNSNSSLAKFRNPSGITYYNGKLYVTDSGNHAVRSIVIDTDPANRTVETYAGTLSKAGNTMSAPISEALFSYPTSITVVPGTGEFFIADTMNHSIKKISSSFVNNYIGTGFAGKSDDYVSSSDLSSAQLNSPLDLVYDSVLADLYINDYENKRILRHDGIKMYKVTDRDNYYTGLGIYQDPSLNTYLEYLEQDTGRVYSMDIYEYGISNLIDPTIYKYIDSGANFSGYDFLNQSFFRYGSDFFMWGLKKDDDVWTLLKFQDSTKTVLPYYGNLGRLGVLKAFDPKAVYFDDYQDYLGTIPLTTFSQRKNPSGSNAGFSELLLKYTKTLESSGDTINLSYPILIGL